MDDLREKIDAVLAEHTDLTPYGFGLYPIGEPLVDRRDVLRRERAKMLEPNVVEQVADAIRFLDAAGRQKMLNRRSTSYGWKHVAERWVGRYISNGAMIAAALIRGYTVKRCATGSSAFINIPRAALALSRLKEERAYAG